MVIEKDIETYLTARVKSRGGLCIKYPASYNSGFPDRIILLPGRRMAFVEVKKPKGYKFAELQKEWQRKLRKLGFPCEMVKTKDEVDEFITKLAECIDLGEVIDNYIKDMDSL